MPVCFCSSRNEMLMLPTPPPWAAVSSSAFLSRLRTIPPPSPQASGCSAVAPLRRASPCSCGMSEGGGWAHTGSLRRNHTKAAVRRRASETK